MYVYIVKYNADQTEGRGPMVVDSIWVDDEKMVAEYIDNKPGIMGRTAKWSERPYGDWTMERVQVFDDLKTRQEAVNCALRERALSKLTKEERRALGI